MVNQPFDKFKFIELAASPVWTGLWSYGVSEFIVDDLVVTKKSVTSTHQTIQEEIKTYPNPVIDQLFVETEEIFERIVIYDSFGRVVVEREFERSINVGGLISGVYVISFEKGRRRQLKRFLKI
jgi:hypothetical protein